VARTDDSTSAVRPQLTWAVGLAVGALVAIASAELHGRASRHSFTLPPGLEGRRIGIVGTAAGAFRVWRRAGFLGHRLVLLTGQWSKPRSSDSQASTPEEAAAGRTSADAEILEARNALLASARTGVVRELDVVMPPAALTHRLGDVRGLKEFRREGGAFRISYEGLDRRFSTPRDFVVPDETVLVLVEPSWFTEGTPPDPLAWLSAQGVRWDLALLALLDPAATGEERLAALAYGRTVGAPLLEPLP